MSFIFNPKVRTRRIRTFDAFYVVRKINPWNQGVLWVPHCASSFVRRCLGIFLDCSVYRVIVDWPASAGAFFSGHEVQEVPSREALAAMSDEEVNATLEESSGYLVRVTGLLESRKVAVDDLAGPFSFLWHQTRWFMREVTLHQIVELPGFAVNG